MLDFLRYIWSLNYKHKTQIILSVVGIILGIVFKEWVYSILWLLILINDLHIASLQNYISYVEKLNEDLIGLLKIMGPDGSIKENEEIIEEEINE